MSNSNDNMQLAGVRVLLVEDCPDQKRLYLHFLKKAGADITLECNGVAAVARVAKDPQAFDVIVMDFKMPEMDGLQATIGIRGLGYTGAIIAVTAHDSDTLKQTWFLAGCNTYLNKPLDRKSLVDSVENYSKTSAPSK